MCVLVEPYLSLGDDSLVASGVVVTQSVPEKSTLKAHRSYVVRQRE
jgi:acetyltransferase-like isoleucine patch superfamily enzyme